MSSVYWSICGIGICTEDIEQHIDKSKLVKVLLDEIPNDEELQDMIENEKCDKLVIDDYLYGQAFDNIAEILCCCDDTNTLYYGDNGHGMSYLYYEASMPWNRKDNEPETLEEVHKRIVAAVQKITSLSSEDIEKLIDDYLNVVCCG